MEFHESHKFIKNCFHEEPASCSCACPFELDLRAFLKKAANGRWVACYREFRDAVVFPAIVSELCEAPCRGACQRQNIGDKALNIPEIERACIRFSLNEQGVSYPLPPKSQKIAIIGAGAAGLSCALGLARKKYDITVFDKQASWGGRLRQHPFFEQFQADFALQFKGLAIQWNYEHCAIEDELNCFDAVYLACGKGGPDFGLLKSWNSENFSCERPGWFLGGELCGMSLMEGIAAGRKLSQLIEAFLQTGKAELIVKAARGDCVPHALDHTGEGKKPMVIPENGETGYSKAEAKKEAARCMGCICDSCLVGCELLAHYRKAPYKLATDICGDSNTKPPFSNCEATRQVYSCNMCSRCEELCPEGVNMGELFRFSREDRWEHNRWVPAFHDFWLRELDFNSREGFYASPGTYDYVFFPGCQLTASLPLHMVKSFELLEMELHSGLILGCCGAPAVWAGDQKRKSDHTKLLRSTWESMNRPVIITACATCKDLLQKLLPDARLKSLYEVLDRMAPIRYLPIKNAALFDPCSARKDGVQHAAVKSLAEKAGCDVQELKDGGTCCGYGGHIRIANPGLYQEITEKRSRESEKPYIVYCANCLEVFKSKNKPCAHILEFLFGAATTEIPSLEEKRRNTVRVKSEMMQKFENRGFHLQEEPWDALKISFSQKARKTMEERLICDSDLAQTIYQAETTGMYFTSGDGMFIASFSRKYVTYWVNYIRMEDGSFWVDSCYSHRMKIVGLRP